MQLQLWKVPQRKNTKDGGVCIWGGEMYLLEIQGNPELGMIKLKSKRLIEAN